LVGENRKGRLESTGVNKGRGEKGQKRAGI